MGQAGRTEGREGRRRARVGQAGPREVPYVDGVLFEVVVIFHLFEEMVDVFLKLGQLFQKKCSCLQDERFHPLK